MNDEGSNTTGNAARARLEDAGFERQGRTAALESDDLDVPTIMDALRDLLDILESPPGGGTLDHLWIYVDDSN